MKDIVDRWESLELSDTESEDSSEETSTVTTSTSSSSDTSVQDEESISESESEVEEDEEEKKEEVEASKEKIKEEDVKKDVERDRSEEDTPDSSDDSTPRKVLTSEVEGDRKSIKEIALSKNTNELSSDRDQEHEKLETPKKLDVDNSFMKKKKVTFKSPQKIEFEKDEEEYESEDSESSSSEESESDDSERDSSFSKGTRYTSDVLYKLDNFENTAKEESRTKRDRSESDFDIIYRRITLQLTNFKVDLNNNLRKNRTIQGELRRIQKNFDTLLLARQDKSPREKEPIKTTKVPPLDLPKTKETKNEPDRSGKGADRSSPALESPVAQKKTVKREVPKTETRKSKEKRISVTDGIDLRTVSTLYGSWVKEEDLLADMKIQIDSLSKGAILTQDRTKDEWNYDTVLRTRADELVLSRTSGQNFEMVTLSVTEKSNGYSVTGRVKIRPNDKKDSPMNTKESFVISSYVIDSQLESTLEDLC